MKSITELFPRASKAFLDANQQALAVRGSTVTSDDVQPIVERPKAKRGRMNKTESEFALILEAMKRKGEILRYEFEGITLRFAGVKYTPDFVVIVVDGANVRGFDIKFIEVKGAFIKGNRERAVERFRHAKTYWLEFQFEMHQKKKGSWNRIY